MGRGAPAEAETPELIIGWFPISGGGYSALYEAIELGLDVFITGEPNEWVMNVANEAGIHFLAGGHYATEVLGVQALGEHVADRFGIDVEFIDVPNPV